MRGGGCFYLEQISSELSVTCCISQEVGMCVDVDAKTIVRQLYYWRLLIDGSVPEGGPQTRVRSDLLDTSGDSRSFYENS